MSKQNPGGDLLRGVDSVPVGGFDQVVDFSVSFGPLLQGLEICCGASAPGGECALSADLLRRVQLHTPLDL